MIDKDLEEISIHELNRIGARLRNDVKLLKESPLYEDKNGGVMNKYIDVYNRKIKNYNAFIRETNMYRADNIVKYYLNKKDGTLSYTVIKKRAIGFL